VSDPAQVEAIASAVERDLGGPGVVIHNAVGGFPKLDGRNARIKLQGAFNPFRHPKQAMVLSIGADDLDA
jgi:hypothetical protein